MIGERGSTRLAEWASELMHAPVGQSLTLAWAQRPWSITAASALLVLWLISRRAPRLWRPRDTRRWFDSYERSRGRARAGGRCEYSARRACWRRCADPAQEADHFLPWARGGATSMDNLVAACRAHNQAKGGRMPSWLTAWLIFRRRRSYFPSSERRWPGSWAHKQRSDL